MLLPLSTLLTAYCDLRFLRLPQWQAKTSHIAMDIAYEI